MAHLKIWSGPRPTVLHEYQTPIRVITAFLHQTLVSRTQWHKCTTKLKLLTNLHVKCNVEG